MNGQLPNLESKLIAFPLCALEGKGASLDKYLIKCGLVKKPMTEIFTFRMYLDSLHYDLNVLYTYT